MVKENLPTNSVRDEEIKLGISDHKGGIYSADFKRLLKFDEGKREKGPDGKEKDEYIVHPQCEIICDYAFNGCYILKMINLSYVKHIGKYAFFNCKNMKTVVTSNHIEHIGRMAFQYCSSLEEIRLSVKMETIEEGVFSDCSSLREIYNMQNVQVIKSEAFMNCWRLQKIELPECLITIENSAFEGCDCLEKIILPISLQKVGERAFAICGNLKSIQLGNAHIASNAFFGCHRKNTEKKQ